MDNKKFDFKIEKSLRDIGWYLTAGFINQHINNYEEISIGISRSWGY